MPELGLPHHRRVATVAVSGESPRDRGRARGAVVGDQIRATAAAYQGLFTRLGIPAADQLEASGASLSALRDWAPRQHDELAGVAEAAGLDLVDLGVTVARTEILTLAEELLPECSLLVHAAPGGTVSAQTWDWYVSLVDVWHPQVVEALPGGLGHVGFTEYGMTGKIGLNAARVGVHLNILKHRDDAAGGVPVHAVLARVLDEADSVQAGVDIVRSASTSSSSTVTVVGPDEAAMVEIAGSRTSVLAGEGWRCHTNHFLAEDLQDGAMLLDPASKTRDRLERVERWTGTVGKPRAAEDLVPILCPVRSPQPGVGILPDETQPEHERLATLVTVLMEPAAGRVRITPGVITLADEASALTLQVP